MPRAKSSPRASSVTVRCSRKIPFTPRMWQTRPRSTCTRRMPNDPARRGKRDAASVRRAAQAQRLAARVRESRVRLARPECRAGGVGGHPVRARAVGQHARRLGIAPRRCREVSELRGAACVARSGRAGEGVLPVPISRSMNAPPPLNVVCWRGTNGFGAYHLEETERPGRTLCERVVPEGAQRTRTDGAETCPGCLAVLQHETRKRLSLA